MVYSFSTQTIAYSLSDMAHTDLGRGVARRPCCVMPNMLERDGGRYACAIAIGSPFSDF